MSYYGSSRVDSTVGLLKWPDAADETNSYWNEVASSTTLNTLPIDWKDVDEATPTMERMVSVPRHLDSLSNKKYRITIKVYNIEELYDGVHDYEVNGTTSYLTINYSKEGTDTYIITISNTMYGHIIGKILFKEE